MGACKRCGLSVIAVALVPLAVVLSALIESPVVTPFAWDKVLERTVEDAKADKPRALHHENDNVEAPVFGSGKMFDKIAFAYDVGNRWMSLGLDQFWRKTLINECLKLRPDDRVLDLATGTADVALLVGQQLRDISVGQAKAAPAVFGVDPSTEMLRHGVQKIRESGFDDLIHLHQGDAQNLSSVESVMGEPKVMAGLSGIASESINKVSMSFGIRNVPDRSKALREMVRVLRKEETSKVCILEFSLPDGSSLLSRIAQIFIQQVIPFIGKVATLGKGGAEYQYLERSIVEFPMPKDFATQMTQNGLPVESITAFAYGSVQLYSASVRKPA